MAASDLGSGHKDTNEDQKPRRAPIAKTPNQVIISGSPIKSGKRKCSLKV